MGYTHYYRIPKTLDAKKFKTLAEELHTAAQLLPVEKTYFDKTLILCDGVGQGHPEFSDTLICFNGCEADGTDHETFYLPQDYQEGRLNDDGLIFHFCKTARKPYDLMVCLSLLRLKHHFPECEVSSDGDATDWKPAKTIYKKIFGEPAPKFKL